VINPSGEIEGFTKVSLTRSNNWVQVDTGIYLATDPFSLSVIICNDDGTKCRGIPYSNYWN